MEALTPLTPHQLVSEARRLRGAVSTSAATSPAQELTSFYDGVAAGTNVAVALPWQTFHALTQALLPGSVTVICGDPGVGKTFFVLECLRHWVAAGHDAAVFFIEKDRRFYTQRLLAQLEGNAQLLDLDKSGWVRNHAHEVRTAMARHRELINSLGARMMLEPTGSRATLQGVYEWVRDESRNGRRLLVVDPITAAHVSGDRWVADDDFMVETQKLLNGHGASLMLVTHPRKGNVIKRTGHDMAAGAAYFRFSDTTLWMVKHATPKRLLVAGRLGRATCEASITVQIHKARMGRGADHEVAFSFDGGLRYREHGLVIGDGNT